MELNFLIAAGFGAAGFAAAGVTAFRLKNCARKAAEISAQLSELQTELEELQQFKVGAESRISDHSRKMAWLETRIRKPEKAVQTKAVDEEFFSSAKLPMNMTERRHRVLTLARRGHDANAIANSLGMLIGEVELIMSIGRGTKQFARQV